MYSVSFSTCCTALLGKTVFLSVVHNAYITSVVQKCKYMTITTIYMIASKRSYLGTFVACMIGDSLSRSTVLSVYNALKLIYFEGLLYE